MDKDLFSRKQKYEIITGLEGRGEIPSKFVYVGKGAKNWRAFLKVNMHARVKGLEYRQAALLEKKLPSIWASLEDCKNLNLIDLGPGTGGPALQILRYLTTKLKKSNLKYVPIDMSADMLKIAESNVRKKFGVKIEPYLLDFESGNFSDITFKLRNGKRTNLMVLLGNTLGNAAEMHRVLENFKESMTKKDYLLIGVELINEHLMNRAMKQYYGKDVANFAFWPLDYLGVKQKDCQYRVRFNRKQSRAELFFVPKKDIRFKMGYENVMLAKNSPILKFTSTKFSGLLLNDVLSDVGFRTDYFTTNYENNFALVLCQTSKSRNLEL
jgi:uncharacterized SAM-dependent methyltransferase